MINRSRVSTNDSSEWLRPYHGPAPSGPIDVNLLWRCGPIYVMDNHRTALWAWWQHLPAEAPVGFLHLDRHYDALWAGSDLWEQHDPTHRTDLDLFLNAEVVKNGQAITMYRWDNMVSGLLALDAESISEVVLATGGIHPEPDLHFTPWSAWHLLENLKWKLLEEDVPPKWIVDIACSAEQERSCCGRCGSDHD